MELEPLFLRYPQLRVCENDIRKSYHILSSSYKDKGKVLVCGTDSSAVASEHIVGELMKGFMKKRPLDEDDCKKIMQVSDTQGSYICENLQGALPAISLVSNTALTAASVNGIAPDMIFAQQVHGYGNENDVLIVLSTSGESKNILYAAITAKAKGMRVIAFIGKISGRLRAIADVTINAPSTIPYEIQEYHLPIYNKLCEMLEEEFFYV